MRTSAGVREPSSPKAREHRRGGRNEQCQDGAGRPRGRAAVVAGAESPARRLERALMPRHETTDGRTIWTYLVYVVELGPDACAERKSPCKGRRCGKTPLYVGETALTREERLANHRRGHRANALVKHHAQRLSPNLAPEEEYATRPEAKAVEAKVAERLRREGYCVSGGH